MILILSLCGYIIFWDWCILSKWTIQFQFFQKAQQYQMILQILYIFIEEMTQCHWTVVTLEEKNTRTQMHGGMVIHPVWQMSTSNKSRYSPLYLTRSCYLLAINAGLLYYALLFELVILWRRLSHLERTTRNIRSFVL